MCNDNSGFISSFQKTRAERRGKDTRQFADCDPDQLFSSPNYPAGYEKKKCSFFLKATPQTAKITVEFHTCNMDTAAQLVVSLFANTSVFNKNSMNINIYVYNLISMYINIPPIDLIASAVTYL